MTTYDKTRIEKSRQLLRAKMGGTPEGCHKCQFVSQCEKLGADEEVLCELSDEEAGVNSYRPVSNTTGNMLTRAA